MFFLLSKLLDFALLPTVWLLGLLLAAVLARPAGRWRGRWLGAALGVFGVFTNAALLNEAERAWERPAVPLASLAPADAAVLLTGITEADKQPTDRVYLGGGADRLTNALWLYRAGKVRCIIISGGSGELAPAGPTEAENLRTLLRLAAVPDSALLLEARSRNTRENALYTKELLTRHPRLRTLVLVTAAAHQRRALGCFAKVGLHPVPFPADFHGAVRQATPAYWLVPQPDALSQWSRLLHEMAGYAVYKLLGYC